MYYVFKCKVFPRCTVSLQKNEPHFCTKVFLVFCIKVKIFLKYVNDFEENFCLIYSAEQLSNN